VLGVFDDRGERAPSSVGGVKVLGDTAALLVHRIMPYVDRVVITVPSGAHGRIRQLLERLRLLPNEILLVLDFDGDITPFAALSCLAQAPVARLSGGRLADSGVLAKRVQDLVLGTVALVVFAPLMALIALAVALDSPGPVLFRQRRHGFNSETIVVWKFRSMRHADADAHAGRQISAGDPRVTRVGRFIRRTSLDELPQLFNVLRGEMSLVGPRPHAIGMKTGDTESSRLVAGYAHRNRMKPGITSWAAIHGSRGPVDSVAAIRRRVTLDIEYIERQSLWLDLYVLLMTLPRLLGDADTVR
jgi:exopolysaccharide biosynthesis polyprenyl glycosylphosphotransferase